MRRQRVEILDAVWSGLFGGGHRTIFGQSDQNSGHAAALRTPTEKAATQLAQLPAPTVGATVNGRGANVRPQPEQIMSADRVVISLDRAESDAAKALDPELRDHLEFATRAYEFVCEVLARAPEGRLSQISQSR